ncbi:Thiopurine S-methyltransferase [Basidiobolus meristosporus CBS 931.73]|uniref:Thiopurine S-methyltransferase n=1 Tax=Basidiobolus meristosporus CBS 931.73 TaxID=1314790 RepID=A0A1Y1YAD0_9FUNG|nr:Thiopurine S-methyltransferase [Basidiobolus meristosporus CBS 931.73]|eukprot:ORX94961.1 Thiopurine S-methyltransferase [Basidiobolus meristosporus CBS 931.73]
MGEIFGHWLIEMTAPNETTDKRFEDWDRRWKEGATGWDAGKVSPALVQLLEERKFQLPEGKGLVPGCGKGYDVAYFCSFDRETVGLDISPSAVEIANKYWEGKATQGKKPVFELGNFFTDKFPTKFGFAYDYTFFCAIDPEMRAQWGERYAEIIQPGGVLIALMFPLDQHEGGPPFSVSVDAYKAALEKSFDLESLEDCKSHAGREGKEKISVWRRKH